MKKIIPLLITVVSAAFFTVGCGGGSGSPSPKVTQYDEIGQYASSVKLYNDKEASDKYIVYSPEGHLADAPIVLFLPGGGSDINQHNGLMEFIASHGYFVIGTTVSNEYSAHSSNIAFDKALALAKTSHPEMDFSKLAVMGHSQGGGVSFPVMKHFLDGGTFGNDKNIVISIDGWFAFGMDQQDLRGLNTMASYIQFGGHSGTGTDARIPLSISNLINAPNEKAYMVLNDGTPHGYSTGDLNSVLSKKDLLKPILALLDYKLKGDMNARDIVFNGYADTIQEVNAALPPILPLPSKASCRGDYYNAKNSISQNNIDYCHPELY